MTPHDWIEVLNRRWCVRCDTFQSKKEGAAWPAQARSCPRTYDQQEVKHDECCGYISWGYASDTPSELRIPCNGCPRA